MDKKNLNKMDELFQDGRNVENTSKHNLKMLNVTIKNKLFKQS